jgi:type IV pilus assembly protein PilQ
MMLDSEVKEDFKPTEFAETKRETIQESIKIGPQPNTKTDTVMMRPDRRIFIDESVVTNYTQIIDKNFIKTFPISVNFDNVEIRDVMRTFSIITGKNILVGDEVTGYVKARIVSEDWDDVLEAILEIKNIALTLNPKTNIVRIHSKDVLTAQEEYNLKRKAEIRKAMELNKSIAPVRSEIFKLFYSNPTVVKAQIEDILKNMDATSSAGEGEDDSSSGGTSDRVKMTVDARLGSLIVLGASDDLNFIEKLINQIDVPTKQILIEAFVVEVGSDFDKAFGTKIGQSANNITGDVSKNLTLGTPFFDEDTEQWTATLSDGGLANNAISSTTGSLGMLFRGNNINLLLELQAMESLGLSKIVSNPKIFTLDNETATITQGLEIPFTTTTDGQTSTEFKEANLKLNVTPSVVGDGNVILNIDINKDNADTSQANPPISSTKVSTRLLVEDGTIVMIGGIYEQTSNTGSSKTPVLSDIPIFGNLFKSVSKDDKLDRLLIFIAPKIL